MHTEVRRLVTAGALAFGLLLLVGGSSRATTRKDAIKKASAPAVQKGLGNAAPGAVRFAIGQSPVAGAATVQLVTARGTLTPRMGLGGGPFEASPFPRALAMRLGRIKEPGRLDCVELWTPTADGKVELRSSLGILSTTRILFGPNEPSAPWMTERQVQPLYEDTGVKYPVTTLEASVPVLGGPQDKRPVARVTIEADTSRRGNTVYRLLTTGERTRIFRRLYRAVNAANASLSALEAKRPSDLAR